MLVGGDGTMHEGINGLLRRKDGKKIPVSLIPNGSGDDYCGCIGLKCGDSDTALKYVQAGETIKVDVIQCLIDFNSVEDLHKAK